MSLYPSHRVNKCRDALHLRVQTMSAAPKGTHDKKH
nr:MAG TPA: hypothetical protein [Caudoviricetes sp.]DAI15143.1 MAG TPA: hypothetical protein [Caudoviricetes sp.]